MNTDPGDEIAAAVGDRGNGRLRVSHADREQVIGTLKAAFVQGRLDKGEFDARLGQVLAARTYPELAAVAADLPATLTAAKPPKPAGAQGQRPVPRPGWVLMVATAIYAGAWPVAFFLPRNSEGEDPAGIMLVGLTTIFYLLALILAVEQMLDSRREKRSGGQSPPRVAPRPGGQASRRSPSAGPGGQLPPVDHSQQHTAEAARSDPAYPRSPGSRSAHQWRHRGHRYTIGYAGD